MEPNNMNSAGMPNMQNQPGMGSQSVGQNAMEQALAETSASPAPASVPMGAPVKKSGKGMLYGMIVFMILAIGGIGFGAWAMMDGNTQKANLEKQISDLRAQNNLLQEQIAEGSGSSDDDGGNTSAINPEDYIYVGEWGIKIKKPDNLEYVDYSFENAISDGNNEYSEDYSAVSFVGIAAGSNKTDAKELLRQAFMNRCSMAGITRVSKENRDDYHGGSVVYEDDNYQYIYSHYLAVCSEGEGVLVVENDGFSLIANMLSDSTNYSAI